MTAIRVEKFTGLEPRTSVRLLPNNAATTSRNTNLLSGEIRGFHAPREAMDLTASPDPVRRAYRIPGDPDDTWLYFDSRDVDIVRSPIINDTHDRYYVAGDGAPKYNTLARIENGDPFYLLGVPMTGAAISVSPPLGTDITVAYVYTFVTAFGEESQPSVPDVKTGAVYPAVWSITTPTTYADAPYPRNVTLKRIYRTVVGQDSASFYLVAELPLATAPPYLDSALDSVIVQNSILESTTWASPEPTMEGFVAMPNGYMVGYIGKRLMFSEPYRPHAWPAEYELATEFEIVGLGVWNDTLVIGTLSQPYVGQGVSPRSFTMRKTDVVEPCMSRRGVVASSIGVYYPSPNGLMLVGGGGPQLVTRDIVTKDEWLTRYTPEGMFATQYGIQYIAFVSASLGFIFTPAEQGQKFVEIDRFTSVQGIETDKYTGQVYLLYQDRAWDWDPVDSERLYWTWKSKEYHLPKPLNFGAAKIKFEVGTADVTEDTTAYYMPYNDARFNIDVLGTGVAFPDAPLPLRPWNLNTFNGGNCRTTTSLDIDGITPLVLTRGHTLNGIQGVEMYPDWTEPENRMPLGGSLLYPLDLTNFQTLGVIFKVFAGRQLVLTTTVLDEDMIRLPVGFKRDIWQFELISNSNVYSVSMGETGKELETV